MKQHQLPVAEYIRGYSGLWVSTDFDRFVLAATTSAFASPVTKLEHVDLDGPMDDVLIRERLGVGHLFEDVNVFCATALWLLDERPAALLVGGRANIAYVLGVGNEVFAAQLYAGGIQGFGLDASRLKDDGESYWKGGSRALSANTP